MALLDADNGSDKKCTISMGTYCVLEPCVRLRPPLMGYKKDSDTGSKTPQHCCMVVDSYIWIGQGCRVNCKTLGSRVIIGSNTTLSRACQVGDVVIVDSDLVIPDNYKIPSFSRVSAHPVYTSSIVITPLSATLRNVIEKWCQYRFLGATLADPNLPRMCRDRDDRNVE